MNEEWLGYIINEGELLSVSDVEKILFEDSTKKLVQTPTPAPTAMPE